MNFLKDWEGPSVRPVELEESCLVRGSEEESLKSIKLGSVVVSVELLVGAVLMSEHATGAIHALLGVIEGPAVLALELFIVTPPGSYCELVLAVGKSALVLVAALSCLNPVLAQLSLVFAVGVVHKWHLVVHELVLVVVALHHEGCLRIEELLLSIEGLLWGRVGLEESGLEGRRSRDKAGCRKCLRWYEFLDLGREIAWDKWLDVACRLQGCEFGSCRAHRLTAC